MAIPDRMQQIIFDGAGGPEVIPRRRGAVPRPARARC